MTRAWSNAQQRAATNRYFEMGSQDSGTDSARQNFLRSSLRGVGIVGLVLSLVFRFWTMPGFHFVGGRLVQALMQSPAPGCWWSVF